MLGMGWFGYIAALFLSIVVAAWLPVPTIVLVVWLFWLKYRYATKTGLPYMPARNELLDRQHDLTR